MKLRVEKKIENPADQVWELLGKKFASISEWFSIVNYSRPITAKELPKGYQALKESPVLGRYTESSFIKAKEVLTIYSDDNREFEFHAFGAPSFMVTLTRNHTQVFEISTNESTVQIDIEIKFSHVFKIFSPIMKRRMTRMLNNSLEQLELSLTNM